MQKLSLVAKGRELLEKARQTSAGRAAETVYGGHEHGLRQTLVALRSGTALADHGSPGEATLHVLSGRIRLTAEPDSWEAIDGDLLFVPAKRHRVDALTDATLLLTVAVAIHP
ncbi:MAG: cupin domain-containing protein [Acidothermus sp.]|nr:cupin domain-containing protein [Acidothermus sp.]MCL6538549.1 cupin domain-containing protein [Acidothermus sp.]